MRYMKILLLITGLFAIMGAKKSVMNAVVAVVNGRPITLYDVQQRAKIIKQRNNPGITDYQKHALDELIDDDIIYDELKSLGTTITNFDIDNAVKQMAQGNGVSLDALKADLASKGISFDAYKDALKSEVAKSKLVSYKFRTEVAVSGDDIHRYYAEHKEQFVKGKEAGLKHILISLPQNASKEQNSAALKKARMIISKIKNGEPFTALAMIYSDDNATKNNGGELGYVEQGTLYPILDKAIFNAKPGELLGPFQTPSGYEIILVEDIRSEKELPLRDVENRIKNAIYLKKLDESLNNWLLTKKQKTTIIIYKDLL
ncbi:MAG: peptidylprolyl isomerase [Deltaproteobacteria bacterium]|nr:peptidylprolyl isomerase [Deltaproteobacteria bacterium]